MAEPANSATYKEQSYWDGRFRDEASYDWLGTYKVLAPFIAPHIRPHSRVLVVGCGNSTLSADLAAAHPTVSIISTDYSPVVVEAMAAAHPAATYAVGDVRGMGDLFPAPAAFDVIVDKGVMDALVADEASPWSPAPTAVADARAMTAEMRRLLVPGGVFLQVTFHQPHFRLRNYLESDGWAVRPHQVVPVGLGYFFFVCVRDDEREVAEPVAAPVTAIDGGGRGGGTVGGGGG
ncbi:hypothetical protein I4F81_012816 [Pyropia yezoensis]|uniref:Uncharacterized protein n=1 Tax=Pyropia yezoensis TaxID=2788 RepID=A0ACC3CK81_PYRYE|nr:hypothetical protein I4F81_012816 [Neopyropia yezoensis]